VTRLPAYLKQHDVPGLSRWSDRRATIAALVFAVAASALLAAGCGGGSSGSGVAQVASTSTDSNSSSGSSKGNPVAYAACMRSHGVPLFPDPDRQGAISPGKAVNPNSPRFRKAQGACRSLLPAGMGNTTAGRSQLSPQQQALLLRYAKCMRSHGLPNFPDPTSRGLALEPDQVDTRSPRFQAANKICRSLLPKLPRGQSRTTGGNEK
jgi:hypothetical protein